MVDSQPTATDTDGTQHNNEQMGAEKLAPQSNVTVYETNPDVQGAKRNSDIMTSSQFREAERKKRGDESPEPKALGGAEAESRNAKLREMALIEKNRVEVIAAPKGTKWGPILLLLGFIVIIALLWSWFA